MYFCDGNIANEGSQRCLSFGAQLVDIQVARLLCEAISPLAIEAARLALLRANRLRAQAADQARLALQAAQYEADRAFEQFDLVDPKNRLVADSLEQRLNQKLTALQDAQQHLEQVLDAQTPLSELQCQLLQQLGQDFPALWNHPDAEPALKKRLLRAAICEIVVAHQPENQRLELVIHWQGGIHTLLHVKKRRTPRGCKTDPELVDLVRSLASLDDAEIARILNMKRVTMPRSLRWTQDRVHNFRSSHRIRTASSVEDEAYLTGKQVMARLGISRNGVLGLLRIGALHNHQITDFAPWRIERTEVESETVEKLVRYLKRTGRLPQKGGCPDGPLTLTLQD